jgi:hypothetical protein
MWRWHKKPSVVMTVAVLSVMACAVASGLWLPAEPPPAGHDLPATLARQRQPASSLQSPSAVVPVDGPTAPAPAVEVAGLVLPVHGATASATDERPPAGAVQVEQARNRRVESREAAFRAEVMDLEWAANARAQLQLVFASQSGHMQLRSIECRARSCRLELADDAATPLESTVAALARRMPAAGLDTIWPGALTGDDSGSIVVLYLTR